MRWPALAVLEVVVRGGERICLTRSSVHTAAPLVLAEVWQAFCRVTIMPNPAPPTSCPQASWWTQSRAPDRCSCAKCSCTTTAEEQSVRNTALSAGLSEKELRCHSRLVKPQSATRPRHRPLLDYPPMHVGAVSCPSSCRSATQVQAGKGCVYCFLHQAQPFFLFPR